MHTPQWAKDLTDSVIPPVELRAGQRRMHPEHGEIVIVSGTYRDPVYGRISNWWTWQVASTGQQVSGYGANWPLVDDA